MKAYYPRVGYKEIVSTGKKYILPVLMLSIGYGTAVVLNQYRFSASNSEHTVETPKNQPVADRVAALGRLEPRGKIIHVSASGTNQRLMKLLVKEGDEVEANQLIAITDDFNRCQALVENAKARVHAAKMRLIQFQAGEKSGTIEAQRRKVAEIEVQLAEKQNLQQAAIAQQEVELYKTELSYKRYATLAQEGAVSQAEAEDKRLQVSIEQKKLQQSKARLAEQTNTGVEQVNQARATLDSLMSIRDTDTAVPEAELSEAVSQLRQAEIDLNSTYVRAPVAGQILSVNTQVGEIASPNGIVDIGQTRQMAVIAEVYEKDIQFIKVGQPVTVVSEYGGFTGDLQGTVDQIKLQIEKPHIISDDPASKSDARVVQVEIKLNAKDILRVKHLSNLQVRAFIKAYS